MMPRMVISHGKLTPDEAARAAKVRAHVKARAERLVAERTERTRFRSVEGWSKALTIMLQAGDEWNAADGILQSLAGYRRNHEKRIADVDQLLNAIRAWARVQDGRVGKPTEGNAD